jgi:hypothetical protein
MKPQSLTLLEEFSDPLSGVEEVDGAFDDYLGFLPRPIEEEPDKLPPGL